jgi:hypothetical protein
MERNFVTFQRNDEGVKQLAIFIAQLVKEGVTYHVSENNNNVEVHLTGGF